MIFLLITGYELEVTIARKVLPHPQGIKASISYGAQFSKKLHYFLEIDLYIIVLFVEKNNNNNCNC